MSKSYNSTLYDRACDAAGRIHKIGNAHRGIYILVDEAIDNHGVASDTFKAKEKDIVEYNRIVARWKRLSGREKEQYDILHALERA